MIEHLKECSGFIQHAKRNFLNNSIISIGMNGNPLPVQRPLTNVVRVSSAVKTLLDKAFAKAVYADGRPFTLMIPPI